MAFVRFILFAIDSVNDFLSKNCPYIAGAISFYTLFALFPLVLAVISVLGYLVPSTANEQIELASKISDVIPVSSEFIGETVRGVVSARAITGVASIFGLLWAATVAFGAIRKGINAAWGITKPRPFIRERIIDFALVLGAGVLLLAVLFSGPVLGIAREATNVVAPESEYFNAFVWDLLARLLLPILAFGTFLFLYTFLPNKEVRLKYVWPGALAASVAFDATNFAFVWYVQNYTPYNLIYGSVGAVLALMTWVYLSAIIVLFGALVTSRFTEYAESLPNEHRNLKVLWMGFKRVRLKVVESATTS